MGFPNQQKLWLGTTRHVVSMVSSLIKAFLVVLVACMDIMSSRTTAKGRGVRNGGHKINAGETKQQQKSCYQNHRRPRAWRSQ